VARVELSWRQLTSELPAAATAAQYFGPSRGVSATIWFAGRAVGCWMAFKLQTLAMSLAVCLVSAKAVMSGIDGYASRVYRALGRKGGGTADDATDDASMSVATQQEFRNSAVWALAVGGLYLQRTHKLPLPVKALLLPAYGAESLLRGMAIRLTNDDFEKARRKA